MTVIRVAPTVTIIKTRDDLLAGTEQEVDLVIRAGSRAFDKVFFIVFYYFMIHLFIYY